jgi:GMP synthase (glutamine-hydrolysing)
VIETDPNGPIARLGDWLATAGAQLDVRDPTALPADVGGFDGVIVMGGAMGATDDIDYPWLVEVRALLADAVQREIPTWGVCLGAQLLAVACGGQVSRGQEGPEFGASLVSKRPVAATDPLFADTPITPDVIQWHFDVVSALPAGATLLAGSPLYEHQAFRVGRFAWGTQFHVEVDEAILARWAEGDAVALADFDVERIMARAANVLADVEEVWRPVAQRFVDIAADPAGAYARAQTEAEPADPAGAFRAALAAQMQGARAPISLGLPGLRPLDESGQ